jgi:hypothetical protein
MEGSVDRASSPSGVLFGLAALAATGISFVAWLLIAFGTLFDWLWGAEWIYTGLALPAATIGAIVAYTTQRPRYFWLGLAITLIPLVAYVFLDATAPPPPPGWND